MFVFVVKFQFVGCVQVVVWSVLVTHATHCEGLVSDFELVGTLSVLVSVGACGWFCQFLATVHMLLDYLGAVVEWNTLLFRVEVLF